MYYNDYDEYMKNVLGYTNMNNNTYCSNCSYGINYNDFDYNNYRKNDVSNIEQMYPEVYRIINPMVCRMCDNNTQPVTEYLIEQMTDDIYDNAIKKFEIKNVINLNIETREVDDVSKTEKIENRSTSNSTANTKQSICVSNTKNIENETRETRTPVPGRRNQLLRDLIRILIINRIIRTGRPGQNRPPFRPGPPPVGPRPPMPGGPWV